jgi:hypothetical protein
VFFWNELQGKVLAPGSTGVVFRRFDSKISQNNVVSRMGAGPVICSMDFTVLVVLELEDVVRDMLDWLEKIDLCRHLVNPHNRHAERRLQEYVTSLKQT